MASAQDGSARYALTVAIADRCASSLISPDDWALVSSELGRVCDELQSALSDETQFEAVFGNLVAELIGRLGNPDIKCLEQASVYAQSANKYHRLNAAAWSDRHRH